MKDKSGFALVLTLVITALMVALAVEMMHQVYVDTSLSRSFRDGQQASILAESGATGAAKLLQFGLSGQGYTSLTDKWATPFKLDDEIGSIEIAVSEESGKINLNVLVQPNMEFEPFTLAMLKRLGKRLELPDELWGALADWIDSDDLPRSGGAESPYYQNLKPGYAARNGKLLTLAELSLVKGFTPEVLSKIRPFVTVFSDQGGININTAPKEVLAALDDRIDDRMAERILEERQLKPFKSPAELSRVAGLEAVSIGLIGRVTVKGSLFRISSVARVKDAGRAVEAVARLSGGAPEFLSWQEY
ncbi:MAG: type II secretion system minor pseudopilin GspK [Deltaproteobacteria bacterium]|nr:type II secretion system minor pseudopilin GspK [Deltaproteobacteria bacterium]